jgi:FAD dependent oxidoreductase
MNISGERAGENVSFWERTAKKFCSVPLAEDLKADVCVIGARIAGVTTAYLLAIEGRDVVLLDDGPIGGGMTGRTTAHLVNAIDDRYSEIEKVLGEKCAWLTAESYTDAIDLIEKIIANERINCDFERVDGYLVVPSINTFDIDQACTMNRIKLAVQTGMEPPVRSNRKI